MMKVFKLFFIVIISLITTSLWAYEDAKMMRFPDVNGSQVVFVYAGDIWTVSTAGGDARQLTSHEGIELFPKISPDGQWIAFSAEYSGSRQIFVMPATGGTPKQLTWYNSEANLPPRGGFDNIVMGWTSDSKKVFFKSNRTEYGSRMGRYFTVNIDGGLEEEMPIPHGGFAALSPDNQKLAFAYVDREFRSWKRYKGGRASDLWIYDLKKNTSEQITDFKGTDQIPVWFGNKIYFASDRDLWLNMYSYDVATKEVKQLTQHTNFDVMWPSGSNGQIAYEHGGALHILNAETGVSKKITINIKYDNPHTLPYIKNVTEDIHSMAISPSGEKVLFDARGDIFSVSAKRGNITNLTHQQGVRATYPTWSPDGKNIAYFSDETGEYEVYLLENKENAKPRQITKGMRGWAYQAEWSPNSRYLVFFDRSMKLQLVDVTKPLSKPLEIDLPTVEEIRDYTFSPDSRWIAYSKQSASGLSAIWLYNIEKKTKTQLTDDSFSDYNPAFSKCGQYLYFLSNRDFNLAFSSFEFNYLYNNATRIYAMALQEDSPRLFDFDSEPEEKVEGATSEKEDGEMVLEIDFENANQRIMAFPLPAGYYGNLVAIENGIFFSDSQGLSRFMLNGEKKEIVMAGVHSAAVSFDGTKFVYSSGDAYGVAAVAPEQASGTGALNLDDLEMRIEPRKEWMQIFNDSWRIYRDYFYVANIHNVDWDAFKVKYSALVPYINCRFDLDYIIGEMISETNAGHAYVNYGDLDEVERIETGLLGAKLVADKSGKYKIAKIFQGENWNPERRSPLTEQGIDINEGDFLLAINGEELTTSMNPYALLENKANKTVSITVNDKPSLDNSRTYTIKTIANEHELMYLDWVNYKRALVDKLSGGRIGYMHVPNTAIEGNRELHRGMYAYNHKEALIIDDRYNGGGFIPDRMIELVSRKTMAWWHLNGLEPMKTPNVAHNGPKAMLINHYSSSGGDAFPYFFKKNNIGTLIGTRTWGGLVGISGNAVFVDGGNLAVPRFGIYNKEGEWIIEGVGVSPDIEVVDAPHLIATGKDPAIEKAVEVLLKQLEENPHKEPIAPAEPDRSKWIEEDMK